MTKTKPPTPPPTLEKVSAVESNIGRTMTEVERRIVSGTGHDGPPKKPELRVGELVGECVRHKDATLQSFVCSNDQQWDVKEELQLLFAMSTTTWRTVVAPFVQQGRGLFFSGAPGTGKDHLAVAMLKYAAKTGFRCRWLDCQSFYADVAECWRRDSGHTANTLVRELSTWDVLCLSDPVVRGMTESQISTLARIVNDRWLRAASTWVTCNARDLEWAEKQFGDRTLSRLLDGAVRIYCDWEDYRKHPAPAANSEGT